MNLFKKRPHLINNYIADVVYGANDGIITTFAIVSGVQGGHLSKAILIILGFVNLLADGLSMGASSYLSHRVGAAAKGISSGCLDPVYHGAVTFISFSVFGAVPLISFLIPGFAEHQFWISCVSSAISLFFVGSLRVFVLGRGWLQGGLEMLAVGGIAAITAYAVGHYLAQHFHFSF